MGYEKVDAAGSVPALIQFYYLIENLFSDVSLRSMYQARSKKDANDISKVDEFSITEDERDIFIGLVEDAVYDVFLNFLKYTKAIPDSIYHNTQFTPGRTVAELNAMTSWTTSFVYKLEDGGTLTLGTVIVLTDDLVYHNGTIWVKDNAAVQLSSGVRIVNHEAYNQNYLRAIDKNLFKAIRFYTLRDWASTQGLNDDSTKFDNLYLMSLRNIVNYAMQLKKVSLT